MKLCNNTQPVFTDQSKCVALEKKCVLMAGHRGAHADGTGAVWLNGPDLQRAISERADAQPKIIIDLGAKP